jgi:tetratricopeptide (TPR) repeat protein
MSLLRDALKRAEQLKRAQQDTPTPSETTSDRTSALISADTDVRNAAPVVSPATAPANDTTTATPLTKLDLELAPLAHAQATPIDLPSATDRTTPSRPRDRSVPGALRPATEAIMRRDAQNLSLARAAQELEDLNLRAEDMTSRSRPIHISANTHTPPRAPAPATTTVAASAAAMSSFAPEAPAAPINPTKIAAEAAADLEKFADRDTVKRMMAQRIAAEADAMQTRRNRTLAIGGGAALLCVAIGGWYVWKETRRYDSPVAGASLRLSPNINAASNAAKATTAPTTVAAASKLPEPFNANNPINPNIGQLPRPPEVTNTASAPTTPVTIAPTVLPVPPASPALPIPSAPSTPPMLGGVANPPQALATRAAQPNPTTSVPVYKASSNYGVRDNGNNSNGSSLTTAADKSLKNNIRQSIAPRLVTTTSKAPVPPSAVLMAGYSALVAGNAQLALANYTEAVQVTPDNIDAHLGLAVSAARTNELAIARKAFARVLELDPRNGQASAGLLLLSGAVSSGGVANDASYSNKIDSSGTNETPSNMANLVAQERELRKLLQSAPQSASLNFALGNSYANQKRWTDAQQAFFDAFAAEPNNADFAYNLAVSLDQLNQIKLAVNYYEKALALQANGRGGQFAANQAATRATELRGQFSTPSALKADSQ